MRKKNSGAREVFENGILVGWFAWTRNPKSGEPIECFIPRRDEDVEADKRNRVLH